MSAHLAGRGAPAVSWLRDRHLLDRERTLDEITSAILALGLHGTQSRELQPMIRDAFHRFVESRRPLAGLAASDLAAWRDWTPWPQYVEMLESGEPVLPSTRKDILAYLSACPEAAAQAAAKEFAPPDR